MVTAKREKRNKGVLEPEEESIGLRPTGPLQMSKSMPADAGIETVYSKTESMRPRTRSKNADSWFCFGHSRLTCNAWVPASIRLAIRSIIPAERPCIPQDAIRDAVDIAPHSRPPEISWADGSVTSDSGLVGIIIPEYSVISGSAARRVPVLYVRCMGEAWAVRQTSLCWFRWRRLQP